MRSTFKLLFYINRQKVKKNGKCPVMGRITLDGKVSQYSTGLEVEPAYWDADTGRASTDGRKESLDCEKKKELVRLNDALSALEAKAHAAYKENVDSYGFVSAEIIKNAVTGKSQVKETLLALMDEHNEEYAKRVGIDRTRHSYVRYLTTRKHIHNFMKYKYNMEDMPLRSLTMRFMTDFTFYLSTVLRLKVSAYNDYLSLLHKMTRLALKKHILKRDPFAGHIEKVPVNHRYLTGEQFEKLLKAKLPTYRLCHTRDLFVFSTFTGIGRADLANLTEDNIITKEDGSKWIHIARQKPKAECHIKLLDIPLRIIEKYRGEGKDGKLFYVPITGNLNRSLKMIAEQCGLDCHLTYYQSRHSFATLICLNNGVPIESISKMMGHSSIRTTQIYAERGIITITENGAVTMPTAPVWMTQQEMCDAFNVFGCYIRKAIAVIYKNNELSEEETVRHVRLDYRICYDVYSLEMVIAVAFRLRSREAMAFRRFIMDKLCSFNRGNSIHLFFSLSNAHPRCAC